MALNIEIQNENKIIMNICIYAFATAAQNENSPLPEISRQEYRKTENLKIEMNYKQRVEPDKSHSQTLQCWYLVFSFNCVHSFLFDN